MADKLPEWLTMTKLVEEYNELADSPVKSFPTREAGYERLMKLKKEKGVDAVKKPVAKKKPARKAATAKLPKKKKKR